MTKAHIHPYRLNPRGGASLVWPSSLSSALTQVSSPRIAARKTAPFMILYLLPGFFKALFYAGKATVCNAEGPTLFLVGNVIYLYDQLKQTGNSKSKSISLSCDLNNFTALLI